MITLAVVGAPVVEELFFRGLLQGAFTRRIGAIPALFTTAIIFSFAHILNEGLFAPVRAVSHGGRPGLLALPDGKARGGHGGALPLQCQPLSSLLGPGLPLTILSLGVRTERAPDPPEGGFADPRVRADDVHQSSHTLHL